MSRTLIAAAREADPAGDYRRADARALPLPDGCCDLVIAFMSLHDVDDLGGVIGEMGRILAAGGRACIALEHPVNSAGRFTDESATSPFVIGGAYLGEFAHARSHAREGLEMTFHSRHRPLEAYSRALEAAGFLIEALREHPVPDASAQSDRSKRWQRVPLFLHLCAIRRGGG